MYPTAIISGRGREKVEDFVKLSELYYAGSHGLDIVGPRVRPPAPVASVSPCLSTARVPPFPSLPFPPLSSLARLFLCLALFRVSQYPFTRLFCRRAEAE